MRRPRWFRRPPADPLEKTIKLRRRTLLRCMDEARWDELDALQAYINMRRSEAVTNLPTDKECA